MPDSPPATDNKVKRVTDDAELFKHHACLDLLAHLVSRLIDLLFLLLRLAILFDDELLAASVSSMTCVGVDELSSMRSCGIPYDKREQGFVVRRASR